VFFSIFSPKGGVGKTTISLALAEAFSHNYRTCIVEFDFSPGDFAVILNLNPSKTITGISEGKQIRDLIQTPKYKKFDVIIGGYPGEYEKITPDDFNRMINELKKLYEVLILDIQPNFMEICLDAINSSDKVLLVVEDNLAVSARINGFLEWLTVNNLSDLSNFVFLKNKSLSRTPMYMDKIRYTLPVIYSVPFIKKLNGYQDKRLFHHTRKIVRLLTQ